MVLVLPVEPRSLWLEKHGWRFPAAARSLACVLRACDIAALGSRCAVSYGRATREHESYFARGLALFAPATKENGEVLILETGPGLRHKAILQARKSTEQINGQFPSINEPTKKKNIAENDWVTRDLKVLEHRA
jgi:hypothetical protein